MVNEKENIVTNDKPVKEWSIFYEKTWPKSILSFGNFLNRDGIIKTKTAIATLLSENGVRYRLCGSIILLSFNTTFITEVSDAAFIRGEWHLERKVRQWILTLLIFRFRVKEG